VVPDADVDVPARQRHAHPFQHGQPVVDRRSPGGGLGRARYTTLYFVSGLSGSALTYLLAGPNQPSLGASGAIFGLFGATAVLMRRLNYDMRPVIGLLVVNLIISFSPGFNIAWQAHVGGLIGGVVVGYAMVHAPRERRNLVQYGVSALVLVVVVVTTLLRTAQLT